MNKWRDAEIVLHENVLAMLDAGTSAYAYQQGFIAGLKQPILEDLPMGPAAAGSDLDKARKMEQAAIDILTRTPPEKNE